MCDYNAILCVGAPPTLLQLMAMKGADGKSLRVIETIAAGNYKKFGMYLLRDDNGAMVALLKRNHIHDGAESVTEAILQKWLTSDAPTRTYQHLIECLRQSELGALAELIANTWYMLLKYEHARRYIVHNYELMMSWCAIAQSSCRVSYERCPGISPQIPPMEFHFIPNKP